MTALTEFERLEAPGIWYPSPEAQRQDVILSVGDATLVISDHREMALAHWSLAALERVNPGQRPAQYIPGPDAAERLEIDDDTMVRAIEKVRRAVRRQQPHPGRLRFSVGLGVGTTIIALAIFWMPDAVIGYTASLVPPAKQGAIGKDILERVQRVSGQPCAAPNGLRALELLANRLSVAAPPDIVVLRSGVKSTAHLPGRIILLNRAIVEDHESPDVAAGYLLAEMERADTSGALQPVLRGVGLWATLRLMTTGDIPPAALAVYAEGLFSQNPDPVMPGRLLSRFANAQIPATPYAYAEDISGETTIQLIEADPVPADQGVPVLSDGNWVALQSICED